MSNIGSWALAAASNQMATPNGWPEGQAPSTVNDCAREMMSAIRTQWDDAVWFNFYPTTSPATYINLDGQNRINILRQSAATTYTATDIYPVGTRLKVINNNTTKYCSVVSIGALSSAAVALEVTMDSGTLTSTITTVSRSIITPGNTPIPSSLAFSAATQAQMEAATSTTVATTPGRQQYHPSAPKVWCMADVAGAIVVSYNTTSVTDIGAGQITFTWNVDFSSANYVPELSVVANAFNANIQFTTVLAGSADAICVSLAGVLTDPINWFVSGLGDQA